jgi:hypothetical protein
MHKMPASLRCQRPLKFAKRQLAALSKFATTNNRTVYVSSSMKIDWNRRRSLGVLPDSAGYVSEDLKGPGATADSWGNL